MKPAKAVKLDAEVPDGPEAHRRSAQRAAAHPVAEKESAGSRVSPGKQNWCLCQFSPAGSFPPHPREEDRVECRAKEGARR